jgi:hypothetical protein
MTIGEYKLVRDPRIGGNNRPARMTALTPRRGALDPDVASPPLDPVATVFAHQETSAALTVISTRDRHQSLPQPRRLSRRRRAAHRMQSIGEVW